MNNQSDSLSTRKKLAFLWVFVVLNYLYCDVVGLMDKNLLTQYLSGEVEGMKMTESFLLAASILMEIPIAMVLLTIILQKKTWVVTLNIFAAVIMTTVQSATLFLGKPSSYYLFFSVIEISTTVSIAWLANRWLKK